MKIKRSISYVILGGVYLLAGVAGVLTYIALDHLGVWLALLIADVVATLVTFVFSVVFKNASVYDPYWSVAPLVIVLGFAIVHGLNLASTLLLVVIAIWSLRLTANWAYTFHGMEHQDWRYTMLCEKTRYFYPIVNLIGIHLVPTLVVYLCIMPAVLLVQSGAPIRLVSIAPLLLSVLGIVLEFVADIQMHIYRKNRTEPFIRFGIWKHSRHPNYLGEILMWWGVALYCISVIPSLWYLYIGAIANTILFLLVSIPLADGRQSRKEGYEQYEAETNSLMPFKRVDTKRRKAKPKEETENEVEADVK